MKPHAYLAALPGLTLPVMAAAYAATRTRAMEAPCDARGYSDDAYLAYCQNAAFGDYEHAAYDRLLEPRAVANARGAEVVFLGNSRLQVAFSRPLTDAFFTSRGAPYHLLGFGYGESAPFAFRVFHALGLKHGVLIVNVAPFFVPALSPAAAVEVRYGWKTRVDALLKAATQPLHRFLCDRDPGPCPGGAESVFRSRATGQWIWSAARSSPHAEPFVPPPPFADASAIAPMMVAAPVIAAAGLSMRPRPGRALDALAPLTLALFTAALVYHSLVLIVGGGLGQPAWYLHGFAPVLWPILAQAVEGARRSVALRALLAADLVYGLLFLGFATACDAAVYAGCAGTRGGDRYIDVAAAALCWAEPARLHAGLSLLAWPEAAASLLAAGFASAALGVALSLRLLLRGPAAVGEDPEP